MCGAQHFSECCIDHSRGIRVVVGVFFFFFQAEDGIRDLVRSRGLGDVYKRQRLQSCERAVAPDCYTRIFGRGRSTEQPVQYASIAVSYTHLTLPTSDLV